MDIVLLATFFVGLASGFIGAIVGGGGLISIPFLIFIGLPPHTAIATNQLGALGLAIGAITRFIRSKEIQWRYIIPFTILAIGGGYLGSHILIETHEDLVRMIIVIFMLAILPVIFLKPKIGIQHSAPGSVRRIIGFVLYFLAFDSLIVNPKKSIKI